MESSDLKVIMAIFRKRVEDGLKVITDHLIEQNPKYDPAIFQELLEIQLFVVQNAWEEIYGRENADGDN